MKKTLHRYRVHGTDDARVSEFTRWKQLGTCAKRSVAWSFARQLIRDKGYRHVKIIEERIFKGVD